MGGLFSKKEKSRITEQDRAVLSLKKQRDQVRQYQKRISGSLDSDRQLAKQLLKEGKTERAKLLLRKKKYLESLLDKADNQLDQLEKLTHDIEFSQVQLQVVEGLKKGTAALEKANSLFSMEDVERLMDETQEAVEKQREISELISGQLTQEDEESAAAELDQLLQEELEPTIPSAVPVLPSVPEGEPERVQEEDEEVHLPEVPREEPKPVAKQTRTAVEAS